MVISQDILLSFPELTYADKKKLTRSVNKVNEDVFDSDSWLEIMDMIRGINPISDNCRSIYESFFLIYPTASNQWKQYIEHELQSLNVDRVENILSRCLTRCLTIDLWMVYIRFVRICKKGLQEEYQDIDHAFQFAIQNVGEDVHSLPLYRDYIAFLELLPVESEIERAEQTKRILQVYKQALSVPMAQLGSLWESFLSKFDKPQFGNSNVPSRYNNQNNNGVNIDSSRKDFLEVNAIALTRQRLTSAIPNVPIAQPSNTAANAEKNAAVWNAWLQYIQYEMRNPQRVGSTLYKQRVLQAFNQAKLSCWKVPHFWHLLSLYMSNLEKSGCADASGQTVWKEALEAMPDSHLVHYLYIRFLELRGSFAEAKEIFTKMLVVPAEPHSWATFHPNSLVWVLFLFFIKRTEGGLETRRLFLTARQSPFVSYHVYLALAMMERVAEETRSETDYAAKVLVSARRVYPDSWEVSEALLNHFESCSSFGNFKITCEELLLSYERRFNTTILRKPVTPEQIEAAGQYRTLWKRYINAHVALCEPLTKIQELQLKRDALLGEGTKISPLQISDKHKSMEEQARILSSATVVNLLHPFSYHKLDDVVDGFMFNDLSPCNEYESKILRSSVEDKRPETTRRVLKCCNNKELLDELSEKFVMPDISSLRLFNRGLLLQVPQYLPFSGNSPNTPHYRTNSFLEVASEDRAPPLNIQSYHSDSGPDQFISNHACSRLTVSPLFNGFLHVLHNRGIMNHGLTVCTSSGFESRYSGPAYDGDKLMMFIRGLKITRLGTVANYDASRFDLLKELFPVTKRKLDVKRKRLEDDGNNDQANDSDDTYDVFKQRRLAKGA